MYLTAGLTNQSGFVELFVPQAVRGIALMFCYLPANMIAMGSLPPDKLKNAAGLYNLTRDLGGAIGLATIGTRHERSAAFPLEPADRRRQSRAAGRAAIPRDPDQPVWNC